MKVKRNAMRLGRGGRKLRSLFDDPKIIREKRSISKQEKKVIAAQFEHVPVQDVVAQLLATEQVLNHDVLAHVKKPLQAYQRELKIAICHKLAISEADVS